MGKCNKCGCAALIASRYADEEAICLVCGNIIFNGITNGAKNGNNQHRKRTAA